MDTTAKHLEEMAAFIATYGLHTGDQFAAINPHTGLMQLDICAIAYHVTENGNTPDAFFTDEGTARDLIEGNAAAMDCIRAISAAIANYEVPDSDGRPDLIEHVSQWTFTPPIGEKQPPSIDEVIGCILRAETNTTGVRPGHADAYGICLTCRGHGYITTGRVEIPYEELSPRRKQGHALGHRFHRDITKPCPHCDGQDRATDMAVSAHEATL